MVVRVWGVVAVAVAVLCCSPPVDDLPEVKTGSVFAEPCATEPRAIVPLDGRSQSTPDITVCVRTAWTSRCEGRMSFEGDVDASGRVIAIRFKGDATPELRRCIHSVLKGAAVLSPLRCGNAHDISAVGGGISWPRDGGTYVHFAGESGIIPAIRQCREPRRGPTTR